MNLTYYLDVPYLVGNTPEEKEIIKLAIKELKKERKPIHADLLNPKETSLYLYVRVDGFTIKVKTGERIAAKYWDFNSQIVKKSYTGAIELNQKLNFIKSEVLRRYRILCLENEMITVQELQEMANSVFDEKKPVNTRDEFVEVFDQFMEVKSADKSLFTIKKYQTLLNLLTDFEQKKKYHLSFGKINLHFYELFKAYLIKDAKHTNNTIGKYISTFKTFMHWATERGFNTDTAFMKFKVPNEKPDIIYLTEQELMNIYNFDLSQHHTLEKVRDSFCFQCFTGQRFSDLSKIKRDDIRGGCWHIRTAKTKDNLEIPLTDYALEILNKYSGWEKPLPVISNQKTNDYLKEIGKLVGINDSITKTRFRGAERIEITHPKYEFISTHTARRTFVTLSLEKGLRPEVIMEITGHKDYKTMKRYLKITSKVKAQEMKNIWKKPQVQ